MTHDRAQRALLDLAYGELAPEEAREVERHAADCADCAAELQRIASTRRLAARVADERASDRMRSRILAAARRDGAPRPSFFATWLRPRIVGFAATAAVVAVVTGTTIQVLRERERRVVVEPTPAPPQRSPAGEVAVTPPDAPRASPPPRPEREPQPREVVPAAPARSRPEPEARAAAPEAAPAARPAPVPSQREAPAEVEPEASRAEGAPPRARAAAPSGARAAGIAEGEDPVTTARAIMDGVERRRAAGRLEEQRQRVACGEAWPDWRAHVEGGSRIVKLTVREPGGIVREGWYDAAGRLRAARVERAGAEPSTSFFDESGRPAGAGGGADTPSAGLPPHAPTPTAFGTTCGW